MATVIVFGIGAAAIGTLFALTIVGLVGRRFRFWPPPGRASWQYRVFWGLFRVFFVAVIALSVLEVRPGAGSGGVLSITGWCLVFFGFGLATWMTKSLGWGNAHGEAVELQTAGWFAYSRNPVYVATIVGMVGLSLAIESRLLHILLAAWGLLYVVAPILEEDWLEEQYGDAYRTYLQRVPRFLGRRHDA